MTSYSKYLVRRPIQTGCEWRLQFNVQSGVGDFSEGAKFTCQFRENNSNGNLLATLKTDNKNIFRLSNKIILVVLPDVASMDWNCDYAVMDIVRTDLTQLVHLGFTLKIPVVRSVTRINK